nr:RNA methyltransferase [Nanchangia anserum]
MTSLPVALEAASPFLVILPRTQDPGNAGTIVRLADAAGAHAVIACTGTVDLTSPKVIRASVGSVFHVPLVQDVSLEEVSAACKSAGIRLVGADGHAEAGLDDVIDETGRIGWVFGNEAQGLSAAEIAHLDATARLGMWGHAESYNVASAAAICLYATACARQEHRGR